MQVVDRSCNRPNGLIIPIRPNGIELHAFLGRFKERQHTSIEENTGSVYDRMGRDAFIANQVIPNPYLRTRQRNYTRKGNVRSSGAMLQMGRPEQINAQFPFSANDVKDLTTRALGTLGRI